MKKKLLTHLLFLAGTLCAVVNLNAQSIQVVPNPTSTGSFTWASTGGALSGYTGTPIVFNNSLVLEYNATNTSDLTQIKQQLAVYKDGDSLHLIPNPDGGQGVYFQSVQIIFNNKLFFIYLNAAGVQQLASFDGTSITLYPNPDAAGPGTGYVGSPRIYNNTLYLAYVNVAGVTQFGTFNGSGITLIPNPDASSVGFYYDYAVVFDNKICARYTTAAGPKQLATFDGTSWTLWPNPDNTANGFTPVFPIIYHNKLYIRYRNASAELQFMVYDGLNNPTLIPDPDNGSINGGGVFQFPIIYNDTLYVEYLNQSGVYQLGKFDGTTLTLVPNPDASPYGYWNVPIIYNNSLYIFYATADNIHHLAQYQSASNSLKVYPNPDGGYGYWDQPIVYDNNLYFQYYNAAGYSQLGYFGGSSLKLIANPAGAYTSPNGNNGYLAQPIVWNNLLYLQMASVAYANSGNLGFIDGSTLPVTLVKFTAQQSGNTSLVQWQVANEINNAYFSVERSTDGTNFKAIGQVAGRGTVSSQQSYQFTDDNPAKGLNYYRLKQVDIDGNFTYSNIVPVNFENTNGVFKIFPNPAADIVRLTLPVSATTSFINVFDLSGKKVLAKQIGSNTSDESLDVRTLSAGVYQVTLLQGTQKQTLQLIKK